MVGRRLFVYFTETEKVLVKKENYWESSTEIVKFKVAEGLEFQKWTPD